MVHATNKAVELAFFGKIVIVYYRMGTVIPTLLQRVNILNIIAQFPAGMNT